jgi:hypothetical protein
MLVLGGSKYSCNNNKFLIYFTLSLFINQALSSPFRDGFCQLLPTIPLSLSDGPVGRGGGSVVKQRLSHCLVWLVEIPPSTALITSSSGSVTGVAFRLLLSNVASHTASLSACDEASAVAAASHLFSTLLYPSPSSSPHPLYYLPCT